MNLLQLNLRLVFFFTLLILAACKGSKEPEQQASQRSVEDSLGIQYPDTVYPLDNDYVKIKKSLCDTAGFDDVLYTNANTEVISLNPEDSLQRFVFIAEADCGFVTGSCGKIIELIERKGGNYISLIKVCGHIDSIDRDKLYIYYSTFAQRQYVLKLGRSLVKPVLVQVNGIPVDDIKYISRELNTIEDNIVVEGTKTDNPDAILVHSEIIQTEANRILRLYKLEYQGESYTFASVTDGQQVLQQLGGKGRIGVLDIDNQRVSVDLQQDGRVQTWYWERGNKIFSQKN